MSKVINISKSQEADELIQQHNTSESAHNDIRTALAGKENIGAADAVQLNLTSHINDKNNPHKMTAAQLGAATESYVDEAISSIDIPDVSNFVTASDEGEISSEIPTTFNGHVLEEFVLKEEVVDDLATSTNNIPLSANQGKVLNEKITQVNNSISNINSSLNEKLNISGGTLTGALIAQSNTNYTLGQVRNIYLSTEAPLDNVGNNGDIWIVYGG